MKYKTMIAMAVSSLVAASIAQAAPAISLADDYGNTTQTPAATDNSQGSDIVSTPNGNMGSSNPTNNNTQNNNTQTLSPTDTNNSNDEMNADTATGDDDY